MFSFLVQITRLCPIVWQRDLWWIGLILTSPPFLDIRLVASDIRKIISSVEIAPLS